jgi:hypothetical protein
VDWALGVTSAAGCHRMPRCVNCAESECGSGGASARTACSPLPPPWPLLPPVSTAWHAITAPPGGTVGGAAQFKCLTNSPRSASDGKVGYWVADPEPRGLLPTAQCWPQATGCPFRHHPATSGRDPCSHCMSQDCAEHDLGPHKTTPTCLLRCRADSLSRLPLARSTRSVFYRM